MATPDTALVGVLNTGVAALTTDTNLFVGPPRSDEESYPTEAVFVLSTGGPKPFNYLDGTGTVQIKYPTLQVYIRGDSRSFTGARDLAKTCLDAVHDNPPTGYIKCRVRETEPFYLGEEESGAHLFTFNVEMIIEE